MRRTVLLPLFALAACGPNQPASNMADATANAAAPAVPSAAQQAALRIASDYLTHLSKGEYKAAHALWDEGGAASGGSAADLEKAYAGYTSFTARAGEVSATSQSPGRENAIVTATATGVLKRNGEKRDMNGFVYLRRPGPDAEWRVWGVDIRRR